MDEAAIKKVHVVFKTHLDIGFTDMAQAVLDRYVNEYIPHAIELAAEMNTGEDKRFIWTVGSYLIDYYFKHADNEAGKRLEEAIRRGDICWHGLACTTHTELLDRELFEYGLSISDCLDERFGKKTTAAKMTDVPGHTRAMIAPMAEHKKQYLHIGVNASSMVPEVPMTFRWRAGEQEMVVQYSAEYGAPCYLDGMDEVLEFAHTADNMGPQSPEAVEEEMARLRVLYPNAQIVASTMDAYAGSLLKLRERIPVVEEELGDTWIHGIASDPLKMMRYRTLLSFKNRLEREGRFGKEHPAYDEFMMNLFLIAEHTWGMDYKTHLGDFINWPKEDFKAAREADVTAAGGSYRRYESSHAEQMRYIEKALKALPDELKAEGERELEAFCGEARRRADFTGQKDAQSFAPYERITIGDYTCSFDGNGAMVYLEREGKTWISKGLFGRLSYETYSAKDCQMNYLSYNRGFRENRWWSEPDFSKPGLECVEDLENKNYAFGVEGIWQKGSEITVCLRGDDDAVRRYGCPEQAAVTYTFGETVLVRLSWRKKDANRMPEALWFDMKFDVENPYRWQMKKMGSDISPMDVVRGGNRRQHCVEELSYCGADGTVSVKNLHSPLVSVGGRWLYGDYRGQPDMAEGFSYNLFNNKWGTNFKMWCEDDCCFEYEIAVSGGRPCQRLLT